MTYADFKNAIIRGDYTGTPQTIEYIAQLRENWMREEVLKQYVKTDNQ